MSSVLTVAVLAATVYLLAAVPSERTGAARARFARAAGIWELSVAAYLASAGTAPTVMVAANATVGLALLVSSKALPRADVDPH